MDNDSEVIAPKKSKPIKSILIGLASSVILTMVFGLILMFAFIFFTGFKMTHENLEPYLISSSIYLVLSIVVSLVPLVISGYIATKYVPNQEFKFGFIIATILILFSIFFWVQAGSFQKYPFWYSFFSFAIPIPCILFGAKLRTKA
jgi:hypothetical protein